MTPSQWLENRIAQYKQCVGFRNPQTPFTSKKNKQKKTRKQFDQVTSAYCTVEAVFE